jgi:hypothetical protein
MTYIDPVDHSCRGLFVEFVRKTTNLKVRAAVVKAKL